MRFTPLVIPGDSTMRTADSQADERFQSEPKPTGRVVQIERNPFAMEAEARMLRSWAA